jgi:ATP-dependent helicase HrpA
MHFVVSDDDGEVRDVGTDLSAIKTRLIGVARETIAAAAPIEERRGITDWDLGDLPRVIESSNRDLDVRAYPALLDLGDSVALRVVSGPEVQERAMRGGVRRLLLLNAAPPRSRLERLVTDRGRLELAAADIPLPVLLDDCIAAAVDAVMSTTPDLPWTEEEFDTLRAAVRRDAPSSAGRGLAGAASIVASATGVRDRLAELIAPSLRPSVADANEHLGRLVRPGFVLANGIDRLPDVERYVRGIAYRLDHLAGHAARDQARMGEARPLEVRYRSFVDRLPPGEATTEVAEMSWQLEELRLSLFAQPVGVHGPVSPKRISSALTTLGA